MPRVAQGRLLRRCEDAKVARLAVLPDMRPVLATMLGYVPEARLIARRWYQFEPLNRRSRPGLVSCERLLLFPPCLRRLCRRSLCPDMPRVAQGRLLRRCEDAKVVRLAVLPHARHVLATTLLHAPEACLTARRRHKLEPLGRRGRPGLVRCELLRPFDPRLGRLRRRSLRPNVPRVAQGRLLRGLEDADAALHAILPNTRRILAFMLVHPLEA